MSKITVFLSYSHDSEEHAARVRGLDASLSRDGCECCIDVYKDTDEDWPAWMTRQLIEADCVLCVATETYERRFRDQELPDQGRGVGWEAGLIRRLLYAKKLHNDRIFPVVFAQADRDHIPLELQGYDSFLLDSPAGYEALLRKVLKRPLHVRPATGAPPALATTETAPLFARPGAAASSAGGIVPVDLSRIIKYAPAELIGREAETKLLTDAWDQVIHRDEKQTPQEKKHPHVLTYVALGGEGKTSLVAKWAADLAAQDWPGCDAVFAWSFYSQGTREQTAVSSDLFLAEALAFFGDEAMAKSAAGAYDKGRRLARIVGERRALLILDGLEPLQYAPTSPTPGELKDSGIAALLKGLAATSRGLCIVTTRFALPDLRAFHGKTVREEKLTRLSRAAGVLLLKAHGVTGSDRPNLPQTDDAGKKEMLSEFEKLVEDVDGHALTLHLMGSFLKRAYQGDIRRRDRVTFAKADQKTDNGHAFRAMEAYEKWLADGSEEAQRELALLSLMGLFDRPATADCLQALLQSPAIAGLTEPLVGLPEEDWNGSLSALQGARLLTVNRDAAGTLLSLDAHPLLREYFTVQLRDGRAACPQAAVEADHAPDRSRRAEDSAPYQAAWRAAHRRLYEHLCATTPDKADATVEDLQPLYQAVAHGCQAGLFTDALHVYKLRLKRGRENFSTAKLGAFSSDLGALACFFTVPWCQANDKLTEKVRAEVGDWSGFRLMACGRLKEAQATLTFAMPHYVAISDWRNAANVARNLSEAFLKLGEIDEARKIAERGIGFAMKITGPADGFILAALASRRAESLHQLSDKLTSEAFDDAELRWREYGQGPAQAFSFSHHGFHYCDFLLDRSEFERVLALANERLSREEGSPPLLSRALAYLARGMAQINQSVATGLPPPTSTENILNDAVDWTRRSNRQDYIPRALLTRAWLRALTLSTSSEWAGSTNSTHESAQSDLDEAWEIAARSPMPLLLADIHLSRARLFGGEISEGRGAKYPWESPQQDLAEARRLIFKHGYLRRKEELEAAEAAINKTQPPGAP